VPAKIARRLASNSSRDRFGLEARDFFDSFDPPFSVPFKKALYINPWQANLI
jgi:hypothetical protein